MTSRHEHTLWDLTRGQRVRYGAAIAALWLAIVAEYGVPAVSRAAIDHCVAADGGPATDPIGRWLAAAGSPAAGLALAAGAIVLCVLVSGVFQYLRARWAAFASESIAKRLRERLFGHLHRLPCKFHDKADTGDLVQRCTSDVETLRVFLAAQIVEVGRAVLLLVTVVPILFYLDPTLALVSLALFPLIIGFAAYFFRRIRDLFGEVDRAEGRMTTVLQENLTGIRVVRAFARQEFESEKFGESNATHRDLHDRLIRLLGWYWALSDVVCLAQIFGVTFFGAWRVAGGSLTVGTLFAFIAYEGLLIWPIRQLGRVLVDSGKAVVALGRLREILAEPEEAPGGTVLPELAGDLEVDGLTFAYGDEPVLRDVSLRVAAGESVALLGPPGSGKSTLVHLLLRLYEYSRGSVRIDGHELAELDRHALRARVGAVLQEPFLYSRSVRDNLRLGGADASDDELVAAARAADVHDAIAGFADGYDTEIGERGVTLSGGQRQRVSLARALLSDPALLVIDDGLSAVDTETEARILAALSARAGRRTTILVSHRLSSVAHADRIVVFDRGRIVQDGAHDELVRAAGPYRDLWEIQGALEDEIRGSERDTTRPPLDPDPREPGRKEVAS